jgi:hypothetical protein
MGLLGKDCMALLSVASLFLKSGTCLTSAEGCLEVALTLRNKASPKSSFFLFGARLSTAALRAARLFHNGML